MNGSYSIGEVCEILKCEHHNLRYIEKVLKLNINRDTNTERLYTEHDLNILKMVFELKNEGLNYKAIKKVLERQEEVITDKVEESKNDIVLHDERLTEFINLLTKNIEKSIDIKVTSKLDTIINNVDVIKRENKELHKILEQQQEKHFKELDAKITKWREEHKEKEKESWLNKLFHKK